VRTAAAIRPDRGLRDEAAAVLADLDAHQVAHFPGGAASVAFEPRGSRLLIGAWGKDPARLGDGQREPQSFPGQPEGRGLVAFRAADGTPLQLLLPDKGGPLRLWDVTGRKELVTIPVLCGQKAEIQAAALAADGSRVAVAWRPGHGVKPSAGAVAIWDAVSGRRLAEWEWPATALAFSPDGRLLAGGNDEGRVEVWSLSRGEKMASFQAGRPKVRSLAFGRDPRHVSGSAEKGELAGRLLAAGNAGGMVTVWDLAAQQTRALCPGSSYDVLTMALSPDGVTLASVGRGEVRLWDLATGRLLLAIRAHSYLTGLAFTSDGGRLAVSSAPVYDGRPEVQVWKLEPGRGIQTLRGLVSQVSRLAFSRDGNLLLAVAHDWTAGLWEVNGGRLRHLLAVPKGAPASADNVGLAFSPSGQRMALSAGRGVLAWNAETGEVLGSWDLPPGLADNLVFEREDELLQFRAETETGSWGDPMEHPRSCRFRRLIFPGRMEMIKEVKDFNWDVLDPSDPGVGDYVVVEGQSGIGGRVHALAAYERATGKRLWWQELEKSVPAAAIVLDPAGRHLAFQPDNGGRAILMKMPSGERVADLDWMPRGLGPGARVWPRTRPGDPSARELIRRGDETPVLTLSLDVPASSVYDVFTATGSHLAWGNADGSVSVCDLLEVRSRLDEVGLGW
jgi:hypothetical protein